MADIMKGVIRIPTEAPGDIIPAGTVVRVHKIRYLSGGGVVVGLADAGGSLPGKWGMLGVTSSAHDHNFDPPLVFNGLKTLIASGINFIGTAYLYTDDAE